MKRLRKIKNSSCRIRNDGRLELRFYKNKKPYSIYGWTEVEIIEKYKNWKPPRKKIKKQVNDLNFKECYLNWQELFRKGKIKDTTLQNDKKAFNKHIMPKLENKNINAITSEEVQKIINGLNDLKRQQTRMYDLLNMFFKYCVQTKKLKYNYCEAVQFKRTNFTNKGKALTLEQQNSLIEYLKNTNSKIKNLIILYILTGMRRTELLNIKLEDIDFNKNEIHICGTKSNNSNRYLQTKPEVLELFPKKEKPFAEYKPEEINRKFKEICDTLNFQNISIHSLRHTFATRCIEAGVNMTVLQKWLGHSTINLTIDTYSHIQTEFRNKEANKIKLDILKN